MLGDKTPRVESKFKYHVRYTLSEIFRTMLQTATDVGEIAKDLRAIKAEMVDLMERLNRIENRLSPPITGENQDAIRKDTWVYNTPPGTAKPIARFTGEVKWWE